MFHVCACLYLKKGGEVRTFLELEGRGHSWSSLGVRFYCEYLKIKLVFENQILSHPDVITERVLQGIYVENDQE